MLFPFDATAGRTNWPSVFKEPLDYARHEWSLHQDFSSLEEACNYARVDILVYKALWDWAVQHKDTMPIRDKALIFDVLVHSETPEKSFSKSGELRDLKMVRIAKVLLEEYGLKLSRNPANKKKLESAASIITKLRPTPSEKAIENLLRPYFGENNVGES
jgi:hypothetical protein